MKLKALLLFTLLAGFALAGKSQSRKIDFKEYKLANGLTVILHQDSTVPVVAVSVLYHVGSENELPGRTGFAHFFEHLMFEGSKNIPRGGMDKYITNAGGTFNANTTQDRTYYYEILPSNQLKLGLWLESERMMHAKIDTVGVNTQREVVKEEKRMRYDNRPYGSIFLNVFKKAMNGTPYQYTPIGTMADINKAKLGEFMDFYHTFYVPNNAVLSIAGDINMDSTRQLIKAYFGPIARGTKAIPRPAVHVQPLPHEIKDTVYDNIQLPAVIEAYRVPKQGSPDYYAFKVLAQILSGGPSSRMNKALVDKDQLAVGAASLPYFLENAGLIVNYAIANMSVNPDTLEQAMDEQVEKIKNNIVPDSEFHKVMNQITTDFVTSNSTMAGIAESLATYQVFFGDANLINTELERYKKVTPQDVQHVAQKYLNDNNRVVLYYLPKQQKDSAEK